MLAGRGGTIAGKFALRGGDEPDARPSGGTARKANPRTRDRTDSGKPSDLTLQRVKRPADAPVLESGLVMLKERASRKGIALGLEVADDIGSIDADERKVKQVLFNLLTNAVKFTPEGGKVTITARRTDDDIEIAVVDNGVGIVPEDLGKIFEEFVQARNQAGQSEGTGLGLTLCQRYVELHGGRIWVDSTVGQGSTFAFRLPVKGAASGDLNLGRT